MALEIFVPSTPYSEQQVSLGESVLTFEFKFNSRNSSWYLNLYDSQKETEILTGIKIQPNQNLTGRYKLEGFPLGALWCLRVQSSEEVLGRYNLGVGKNYSMFYLSDDEELERVANGFIQL